MKGQGKIKYWFTKNGVHIPVYESYTMRKGVEPENVKAKFKKKSNRPSGIPDRMPTQKELLDMVKKLKGQDLKDAIERLDSLGSYYREDKRQQRKYLEECIRNFQDDPAVDYDPEIADNYDLIYVVTGISPHSMEFTKKFGRYDPDEIYKRARNKK